MIAIVLSLLVVAAVAYIFVNSSFNARFDDQSAGLQEGGRFAIHFLADDLRMANFWGYELQPSLIEGASATVCGIQPYRWESGTGTDGGLMQIDEDDWPGACAGGAGDPATPKDGTTLLVIKRVSGTPTGLPNQTVDALDFPSGKPFLLTSGGAARLVEGTGSNRTLSNTEYLWEYMTHVYYISDDSTGEPPNLCRKVFTGTGASDVASECLVSGIEDFRLLYGIDADRNGKADVYSSAPESLPMATTTINPYNYAMNVRLCVLARSEREIQGYTDDKTYDVCEQGPYVSTAPGDKYLRKVFEKVVSLRNTSAIAFFN
jgi:type IV pilus assembly protein PilW